MSAEVDALMDMLARLKLMAMHDRLDWDCPAFVDTLKL